jgi:hypothetical protein
MTEFQENIPLRRVSSADGRAQHDLGNIPITMSFRLNAANIQL